MADEQWRPYLKDRKIKQHPAGFVVIVPQDASSPLPLWCELCDFLLRSRDDEVAYLEFGCCHRCALKWAHPRRQAWRDGWRPSEADRETFNAERPPLTITFDVD